MFSVTPQRQDAIRWRQTWTLDFRNNLVRENPVRAAGFAQNLRMQGQYLDRDKCVGNTFEQRVSAGPKGEPQGSGE